MSSASPILGNSRNHVEVPMNVHQLGLVDNCYEEHQYDEGNALLRQLRSPNVMPSASHIRQLLYLSLYPQPRKNSRSLLVQFARTNSPEGVARALPSYDCHNVNSDSSESFIAKESRCISEGKNCWNILQKGFIHRTILSSPTKKGSRRTNTYEEDSDDDSGASDIVAEHAWPILDFLLILFERDECEAEARGLPPHSPLLLNQIPAPRSVNEQRRRMGARLMQLLINLCSTNLFDFTMFLNSVFNRVYTSAPKEFLSVLVSLPPTVPCGKNTVQSNSSRPKPQARAKPIRRTRDETKAPEEPLKFQPTSIHSQINLPLYVDIHRSIEELTPDDNLSYTWIQFQLLTSFGIYQASLPADARDDGWLTMLRSREQLDKLFSLSDDSNVRIYREILNAMVTTWKS
ncbi:hypothetical protein BDP27DRAFT_1324322 [Rhodocollybia butyracea]|uniref:Uncharacterized protein n=1 Tax=Rhodocollybia butyracea TaxID=206335 RepID=A0A9P5PVL6_9AGAR|nr:hypothetical protein BDP27DRAFT_1324322 [Rhodocollybia butyracea]